MSIHYRLLQQLFPAEEGQKRFHPQFRLEGSTHDPDSREGLAMPIADPLWMLAKQWQLGEFLAEDNGSPAAARIHRYQHKLNRLRDRRGENINADPVKAPLEYLVESVANGAPNIRERALAGHRLTRLIRRRHPAAAEAVVASLIDRYPLQRKADHPSDRATDAFLAPLLGHVPDGWAAWRAAEEDLPERAEIEFAWTAFDRWMQRTHEFPTAATWNGYSLDHQFQVTAESESGHSATLSAPDYRSGNLDWFSFDQQTVTGEKSPEDLQISEVETPVSISLSFAPEKRLYTFEDKCLDLAGISVDPSNLLGMLLTNFAYVSSNDWFVLPLSVGLGELTWIDHLEVKDVFGITTRVRNGPDEAGKMHGPVLGGDPLQVWDLFKIRSETPLEYDRAQDALFLAPVAAFRLESEPLEDVYFLRDEYANYVWGVEKTVRNGLGQPVNGLDLHQERNGPFLPERSPAELNIVDELGNPLPAYRLAAPVNFNWIPYLPVHVLGSNHEVELQRGRMVRPDDGDPVSPISDLILRDIERIREEAVPRSGTRVRLRYQRVRWTNGETFLWIGREVSTGTGEGNSGLRFDWLDS